LQAQVPVVALSSIVGASLILPDFDSTHVAPFMRQLGRNLALRRIGKFACVTRALALFALTFALS
jgi:hypothetical protein